MSADNPVTIEQVQADADEARATGRPLIVA